MRDILQDIGLSPNESKIYLSLLESGRSGATQIARKSKLHRANVYQSLERLREKSLISQTLVNGSTKFEAAPPNVLATVLDEKKSRLNAIMPQLQMQKKFSENYSSTQIIEGVNGFVSLLHDLLFFDSVFVIGSFPKTIAYTKMIHFEHQCKKRNISFEHVQSDAPSTIIAGDTVMITLWEKEMKTIVIKNKSLADSYSLFFETMKNAKTAS